MAIPRYARAREQAGLSVQQATKLLGWERGALECIEAGRTEASENMHLSMATVYGCSVAWLRGDYVEPPAELVQALIRADVSDYDRAIVLEFAASIQGMPPRGDARARLERVRGEADGSSQPIASKRRHVARQGQTRDHGCHWPGCKEQVPPAMWGCKAHWFALPKVLRDRVWRTYAPGQEVDCTPSAEYLKVVDDVQRWIREHKNGAKP